MTSLILESGGRLDPVREKPAMPPAARMGFVRSAAEAGALWMLRRALCGGWQCGPISGRPVADDDFTAVTRAFRQASHAMSRWQARGVILACNGSLTMTRDESRLLRAIAAAQLGDDGLVDNLLFKLSPAGEPRAALIEAVTLLAAVLAGAGHWLSAPALSGVVEGAVEPQMRDLHA